MSRSQKELQRLACKKASNCMSFLGRSASLAELSKLRANSPPQSKSRLKQVLANSLTAAKRSATGWPEATGHPGMPGFHGISGFSSHPSHQGHATGGHRKGEQPAEKVSKVAVNGEKSKDGLIDLEKLQDRMSRFKERLANFLQFVPLAAAVGLGTGPGPKTPGSSVKARPTIGQVLLSKAAKEANQKPTPKGSFLRVVDTNQHFHAGK